MNDLMRTLPLAILIDGYGKIAIATALLSLYAVVVRYYRYQRCTAIQSRFQSTKRPLSSMTVKEAHQVVRELRELEFPYSLHNAMKISLLKTSSIPTMTKLFQATGQLNERNAPKRAADTEVLLNEVHDRQPGSNEHLLAISRINYLHSRFRKAGKILDEDMLHTLGSAVVDIFRSVDENEWRVLSETEKCAIGVFHKALGDAMEIDFRFLESYKTGWVDGGHFARELCEWTLGYEKEVAKPAESTRNIGRRFMDLAQWNLPGFLKPVIERVIASKVDEHIRVSMGFANPGIVITTMTKTIITLRKLILRYFALPRPESKAIRVLNESPDPTTGLYTINLWIAQPWYIEPSFKNRWGLKAMFARFFGDAAVPSQDGAYREAGYDLRTIGPAAQEKRGHEEMEVIFEGLRGMNFAGGCPFHA